MDPHQLSLFEAALPGRLAPEATSAEELPEAASADEILAGLRGRLAEHLSRSFLGGLTLTDNRSTILSSRPGRGGGVEVRMHWSFFDAPDRVLAAVGRIVDGVDLSRARGVVREWVAGKRGDEPPEALSAVVAGRRARAATAVEPVGHVHDLEAIRDEVNDRYFAGRHRVAIGWSRVGRARRRGRRRTIKLGSWSADDRTVRIHPVLDHESVPRWVVASVVHHELLHADIDPEVKNGRRRLHTPEFRRREREFARYEDARRWIDLHLRTLLRRRARLAR